VFIVGGMTDIPKTKYGAAVCLFKGEEVYLSQRQWNQLHFSNLWQFVHGYVKGDYERYADAAVRIVRNEAGIVLPVQRLCYIKSLMLNNEFYYTYFVHLNENETPAAPTAEQLAFRGAFVSFPLQRAINLMLVPGLEKMLRMTLKTLARTKPPVIEEERNAWSCMADYD